MGIKVSWVKAQVPQSAAIRGSNFQSHHRQLPLDRRRLLCLRVVVRRRGRSVLVVSAGPLEGRGHVLLLALLHLVLLDADDLPLSVRAGGPRIPEWRGLFRDVDMISISTKLHPTFQNF